MSISFITGDFNKAIILFLVPFEFKVLCQGIFKIHMASEICTLPSHQDFSLREDTWTTGDNLCRKKKLQDLSYALPWSTTDAKKKNFSGLLLKKFIKLDFKNEPTQKLFDIVGNKKIH